jgi:hypothetical protein
MSDLFGRVVVLEVGQPGAVPRRLATAVDGVQTGLRLAAVASKTAAKQDDTTEITAYGLAPETVAQIRRAGALCRVLAGYGQATTIGAGRVLPATLDGPRKMGGDMVTRWSITDGGLDIRDALISESWPGGASASEVLDRVIARSGLARGVVRLGEDVRWATGYAAFGSVRQVVDRLARATRSAWAVQDGAIQVWPIGEQRLSRGYTLSPSSGLLDSPEQRDGGRWLVRSLLLPSIRPGDAITVRSRALDGAMIVQDVTHSADSWDGAFESALIVRPP